MMNEMSLNRKLLLPIVLGLLVGVVASVWVSSVLAASSDFCTTSPTDQPNSSTTESIIFCKDFGSGDPQGFTPDQFSFRVEGGNGVSKIVQHGGILELEAGTYTVTEVGPNDFEPKEWTIQWSGECNDNDIAEGELVVEERDLNDGGYKICTANNQYKPGQLEVKKEIVGTTTSPSDFQFTVNGGAVINFDASGINLVDVPAGEYDIKEVTAAGYVTTYSSECSGIVANNDKVTCTITNTYTDEGGGGGNNQPATLTIVKNVINDNTGSSTPSDFAFTVNGTSTQSFAVGTPTTSTTTLSLVAGTYTIEEVAVAGYTASYTGCSSVALTSNSTALCVITNDDKAGDSNGGGGGGGDEYRIEGFVWHDQNRDHERNDEEEFLSGWTVQITNVNNSQEQYSTTTDSSGDYYFEVSPGTWRVQEVVMNGWVQTTPADDSGAYVVTVPQEDEEEEAYLWWPWRYLGTVAVAAVVETYSGYNFGNDQSGSGGGNGDGNGGGNNNGGGGSSGGGSRGDGSGGPTPQVLGEQVSAIPQGAPNAGAGGAAVYEKAVITTSRTLVVAGLLYLWYRSRRRSLFVA